MTLRFDGLAALTGAALFLAASCFAVAPQSAPTAGLVKRQPLTALPIVKRIKVPVGPAWLEIGFDSVWLSKIKSRTVFRIDPLTNRIVARIAVGPSPELGIGIGLGSVWIADTKDHSLTQIDPGNNAIVRRIPVNIPTETEGSFGLGEGSIWIVTNEGGTDSGTLSRIDPVSGKILADIKIEPKSHAVVAAFGSVWVSSSGQGTVTRVDPRTNTVVAKIAVHASPRFMAAGEGSVWVLSQSDGTLARIDPITNQVLATIEVGVPGDGGDLSIGENYVWVAAEHVPLSQVDPRTNSLVSQFAGGRLDDTMRVGFGSAWIVDEAHGQIWRADLNKLPQGTSHAR